MAHGAPRSADETPLDEIDVSQVERFEADTHGPFFARLRRDDPVHFCPSSAYGPYWSITRYDDIQRVDSNHGQFSSKGDVIIGDVPESFQSRAFMISDPPEHTRERRAVRPALSPQRVAALEEATREQVRAVLDELPRGVTFDWVEKVSVELTTRMVAMLFDFPWESRHLLPYWSDVLMETPRVDVAAMSDLQRETVRNDYLSTLQSLWRGRAREPARNDLISALARNADTAGMVDDPAHLLGTVTLMIGANDTSRSAMSGAIVAFHRFPSEWEKLRENPSLIPNAVSEIVRWQTPLAHMRRTATDDVELRGKCIRRGDKVVMWFCSANRDEACFDDPDTFRIDRANAKRHLGYGFGIHRCVGKHVAQMQLRVLCEELVARFRGIELAAAPRRTRSNYFAGYDELLVRII